jgi:hypothetical protein
MIVVGPNPVHLQLHHVVNPANEMPLQGEHTHEPASLQLVLLVFWIMNTVNNIQKFVVFSRPSYLGGGNLAADLEFLDIIDGF